MGTLEITSVWETSLFRTRLLRIAMVFMVTLVSTFFWMQRAIAQESAGKLRLYHLVPFIHRRVSDHVQLAAATKNAAVISFPGIALVYRWTGRNASAVNASRERAPALSSEASNAR